MTTDKLLYTTAEVAAMTGLKPRKIWDLARTGRIEYHRIDQQLRFSPAQLSQFLDSTRVAVVADDDDMRPSKAMRGGF